MFGNGYELTCVLSTPDVSPRVLHRAFTALRVFRFGHTRSQPPKGPPTYARLDVVKTLSTLSQNSRKILIELIRCEMSSLLRLLICLQLCQQVETFASGVV